MAGISSREQNPIPGVEYSEISIPDDESFGTGVFTTMLEPKALKKNNPIISSIQNEPVFLLIVSINVAIEQATAMLGKSQDTPPVCRKVFNIPKEINLQKSNDFTVSFRDWDIKEMKLNGENLTPAE
jgi:hypothetical protein